MPYEPLLLRAKTGADLFRGEKLASAISRMPDDQKKWPAHIYSELLRELPFLAQYDVEIVLDRTDPEAGAALGYAQVRNRTQSRPQDNISSPGNIIRVPIVVQDRRLQKFYIFEAGKQTYPLTEERVQQAMLNPAIFDTDASRVPTSASLIDQMYPPYQQRQGFGRVTEPGAMGLSKLGSVTGADTGPSEGTFKLDVEKQQEKKASAGHEKIAVRLGLACSPSMYRQYGHDWLENFESTPFYKEALAIQAEDATNVANESRRRAERGSDWAKDAHVDAAVAELESKLASWKYENHGTNHSATMKKIASARDNGTWSSCFQNTPFFGQALGVEKTAADNRVASERRRQTDWTDEQKRVALNIKAAELEAKLAGWRMEQAGVDVKTASVVEKLAFFSYGGGGISIGPKNLPVQGQVGYANAFGLVPVPDVRLRYGDETGGMSIGDAGIGLDSGHMQGHHLFYRPGILGKLMGIKGGDRAVGGGKKKAPAEKTAFIMGKQHPGPGYLSSAAVPYDQRQQAVIQYGRAKADEEPTKRWKAMLAGLGLGGTIGAGLGGAAGGARGAAVGAALGGAGGAALGHVARENDAKEIRRWKTARDKGPDAEKSLSDKRIRSAVTDEADEEKKHRRNMEMMMFHAATRPSETHHHHYSGERY